jgi:hypothetical protein
MISGLVLNYRKGKHLVIPAGYRSALPRRKDLSSDNTRQRAPAVAEPMFTTVVDPDAPPAPRFTVLVTPVVVAPMPTP